MEGSVLSFLKADWKYMSILYRGPSKDASLQFSIQAVTEEKIL
jgi:hypothetical protein